MVDVPAAGGAGTGGPAAGGGPADLPGGGGVTAAARGDGGAGAAHRQRLRGRAHRLARRRQVHHHLGAGHGVPQAGKRVGVLAVDPSSPFSGGALLGDRVRMSDHASDPGVYIRSMATRGHLGGLAWAAPQAIRVLDAAGLRRGPRRDGRRRPVRGGDRLAGRHQRGAAGPRHGRRHPGGQGRNPGDRRRLRRQQGRPGRRGRHRPGAEPHAGPGRVAGARATGGRRSSRRSRRGARASTRWSRRWRSTGPGWRSAACWRSAGAARAAREVETIAVTALRERIGDLRGDRRLDALAERIVAGETDPYRAADELVEGLTNGG